MASKMYILVKESVDLGHAILAAAHASLGGYLTFIEAEKNVDGEGTTEDWVHNSFRKVVVKVTDVEFEKAKTYGAAGKDFRVMTESGLGGMEVAIVFRPRDEWPGFFRSLRLYC
jgi:hypothetical protein